VLRRGVVAAISALILLAGCEARYDPSTTPSPPHEVGVEIVGLSLMHGVGRDSTQLTADRAEYRTRRGGAGFITYHDLTELELAGAELVLDSAEPLPFSDYVERLYSLAITPKGTTGSAKGNENTLTRVLFDGLRISQVSEATTLVLSARRGRLALDSGTLILEGGITLSNDSGQTFEAPHAVLARDYNAIFARGGRWQGGPRIGHSVYLVVDGIGHLSTSGSRFEPSYADAVKRRERMMLEHLAKRVPSSLKPLVYALLRAGHSGPL